MRKLAADAVIIDGNKVLLVKRGRQPFKGRLALPGGHLDEDESLEQCVAREVHEETGYDVEPLSLIGVYSDPARDPRGTVSAAYLCRLKGGAVRAGSDAVSVEWHSLNELGSVHLAFDHQKIVRDAVAVMQKRDCSARI